MDHELSVESEMATLRELGELLGGVQGYSNAYGFEVGDDTRDTLVNMRATVELIEDIWPSIQKGLDTIIAEGYNPVLFTKYYSVPLTFMVQLYTNVREFDGRLYIFEVTDDSGSTEWESVPALLMPSEALKFFGVDLDAEFEDGDGEGSVLKALATALQSGGADTSGLLN